MLTSRYSFHFILIFFINLSNKPRKMLYIKVQKKVSKHIGIALATAAHRPCRRVSRPGDRLCNHFTIVIGCYRGHMFRSCPVTGRSLCWEHAVNVLLAESYKMDKPPPYHIQINIQYIKIIQTLLSKQLTLMAQHEAVDLNFVYCIYQKK